MARFLFIRDFILTVIIMSAISCNNNAVTNDEGKPVVYPQTLNVADTIVQQPDKIVADTILQNRVIDQKYFEARTANRPAISKSIIASLELEKISGLKRFANEGSVKITVIDTLLINHKIKVLVVAARTENESWAWIVGYDQEKFSSAEQIYYEDFVEYFSKTTTQVKDNRIIVTTETSTDELTSKQIEKFVLKNNAKLLLMK